MTQIKSGAGGSNVGWSPLSERLAAMACTAAGGLGFYGLPAALGIDNVTDEANNLLIHVYTIYSE
jgi:hypothetical protein